MPNELKLRGRPIRRDDEGRVCLNDIHTAAGFRKTRCRQIGSACRTLAGKFLQC